jgi:hypothetical protein
MWGEGIAYIIGPLALLVAIGALWASAFWRRQDKIEAVVNERLDVVLLKVGRTARDGAYLYAECREQLVGLFTCLETVVGYLAAHDATRASGHFAEYRRGAVVGLRKMEIGSPDPDIQKEGLLYFVGRAEDTPEDVLRYVNMLRASGEIDDGNLQLANRLLIKW